MTRQNKSNANRMTQTGAHYRGIYEGQPAQGLITDGIWAQIVRSLDTFSYSPYPDSDKYGFMTCRRENRGEHRYWYAYRRIEGKTKKVYIGDDNRVLDPDWLRASFGILHGISADREHL